MLDWLYPQTIEVVTSKINGQIKVTKFRGRYSVWVGGFEQSGPVYVEKVWREALERIKFTPKKVLILGLACGTLVKLLTTKWPKAKITGVEIDPLMIQLGKKYFGLGHYKNLTIKIADAKKANLPRFDLVLADTYLGNKRVVLDLHRFLLPGGAILANHLVGVQSRIEPLADKKVRN